MDPAPALQSEGSALAESRSLRALGRARLDAALRAAPPRRLRRHIGRSEEVPPTPLQDAGASRVPRHAGRRGHHRPARAGHRQRGGDGALPEDARGARGRRPHRQLRVRDLLGWRSDGRRGGGGLFPRRAPPAGKSHLPLRRQPRLPRRPHRRDVHRGPAEALRGVWLAHAADRGRERHRGDRSRCPRRPGGEGSAEPDRGAHRDRVRLAAQGRHARGAWLAAGQGRSEAHQAEPGLAARADLPGARRRARILGRPRRGAEEGIRRLAGEARAMAQGSRPGAAVGHLHESRGSRGPRRPARQGGLLHDRRGGHAQGLPGSHPEGRRAGAVACGRVRRPRSVDLHLHQGRARREREGLRSAQHPLRRPRARDGIDRQRVRLRRVLHPVRRDLPALQRLHAAAHPPGRALQAAERIRLHPRLDLPGRGRAHAPAGRAARRAARHPQLAGLAARRPARGCRCLDGGAAAQGWAHAARADPSEAAAPAARHAGRGAQDPARRVHAGRVAGRAGIGHPGDGLGAAGLAGRAAVLGRGPGAEDAARLHALRGAVPRVAR